MIQLVGDFIEEFPRSHDSLELSFTSSSRPVKRRWLNNRLSACFIADYFLNIMPIEEEDSEVEERIEAMKNAVSYIGNELLENAIKFHEGSENDPVKFGIHFRENLDLVTAVIFTKNGISPESVEKFQAFIEELRSADPHDLYVEQITKAAASEDSEASGLGLLTAINDYSAKLGWKFESDPSNPQMIAVTTMAQVVV